VGLLLAADRFGHLQFSETWPVLIIVFGVMKLFERLGRADPAVGGGGAQ